MINNYNEYIEKLKSLRKQYYKDKNLLTRDDFFKLKKEMISLLRNDIITELSKYFKKVDLKISRYKTHFVSDDSDYDVFLLEDDYGIKVKFEKYSKNDGDLGDPVAIFNTILLQKKEIYPILKNKKYFINGKLQDSYNIDKGSLEDFIKLFVNKVKKQSDIRIKIKNNIELKKLTKKYNL